MWNYCKLVSWINVKNVLNKKIDNKEHNTAKGVSIATEFDKFKDVLFKKFLLLLLLLLFYFKKIIIIIIIIIVVIEKDCDKIDSVVI